LCFAAWKIFAIFAIAERHELICDDFPARWCFNDLRFSTLGCPNHFLGIAFFPFFLSFADSSHRSPLIAYPRFDVG